MCDSTPRRFFLKRGEARKPQISVERGEARKPKKCVRQKKSDCSYYTTLRFFSTTLKKA